MKNMKRILMASLAVLGVSVGLVAMNQIVGTTTASASVKKLSLKQAVKLTNHYNLFKVVKMDKLKLNSKGKIAKDKHFAAGAKRYKKGWKLSYAGLGGGYRANLTLVPKGSKKVAVTRTYSESYEPGTTTKHRTIARKLPKKVWHKGFPKFLRHKVAQTAITGKKGYRGYCFFRFGKTYLSEGHTSAGDSGLLHVSYKKSGKNYYLRGKLDLPTGGKYTYKIHKKSSKSFTAKNYFDKKTRTYRMVKKLTPNY